MEIEFERDLGGQDTVKQKAKERRSTLKYVLTGTTDKDEAESYAAGNLPQNDGINLLDYFSVKELEDGRDGSFEVTAYYKGPEFPENSSGSSSSGGDPTPREISYSFDIAETTRRITHSKETIASHVVSGESLPTTGGAINLEDGVPQGADIAFTETSFSVEMEYPAGVIDNPTIQAWEALAQPPHTNDAAFRGRDAGEVLFVGNRATVKHEDEANTVVFNFKVSKNVTDLSVANGTWTGISKKGWELAWVYQEQREVGDFVIAKPIGLFIERVFDEGDFSQLGVPV